MRFLTLDLNTKLIPSESAFMKNMCGMGVRKVLKSKVGTDLAFLLSLILFSLVAIRNEFCRNQIFLQTE